ncbi:endonuclease/exonuclease/phosphatase family protein [Nocardioides litoris]|uniref:endonuclease/exonuclease/phosphatase family protein n=1 Tax=Nocardioides litoris TaxID=1926648 RepID=UPI001120C006|nr:endonuclease/exonuclease/phosphatase family protein [Nocardioides litoris]
MSAPEPAVPSTALTRRGLVLGGAALGAGAAAAPLIGAGTAEAASTGSFRVAQVNLPYSMSDRKFFEDLGQVGLRSDLIGLNEVWDVDRAIPLAYWADVNRFHLVHFPGTNLSDNAVLARKSVFDIADKGSWYSDDINGAAGPIPNSSVWGRFVHRRTGVGIVHCSMHLPPHIESRVRPKAPDGRLPSVFDQIFTTAVGAALSAQAGLEVVLTGDLNIDYARDSDRTGGRKPTPQFPFAMFEDKAKRSALPSLRSCYTIHGVKGSGTHGSGGRRHIDYVYHFIKPRGQNRLQSRGYSYLRNLHSDHDAVLSTSTVRRKPR